jgi:hypothetical protein
MDAFQMPGYAAEKWLFQKCSGDRFEIGTRTVPSYSLSGDGV